MTVAISFIPPIFEDEYDGLKMRTLVNELERLHAEIIRSFDAIDTTGNEINDLTAVVTWANVPNANITVGSITQHVASIDHDLLLNFLSAEHIDWAASGAGTIHATNMADPILLAAGSVSAPAYAYAGDPDTGVFNVSADILGFGAGGVQIAQAKEVVGANQFIISPGVIQNSAATPSLAFGDGDTGFFETVVNRLAVTIGGVSQFVWVDDLFRGSSTRSAAMVNLTPTNTIPGFTFHSDEDTGMGSGADDQLSLIAGNVEAIRYTEASNEILEDHSFETGITASTAQAQGQRPLLSSYNEVSIVANNNDAVTLPPASEGRWCLVINRGANKLQVFPASGDDLGQGIDSSDTIKSGTSLLWIAFNGTTWHEVATKLSRLQDVNIDGIGDNELMRRQGGLLVGSGANLTYDGSTLTAAEFSGPIGGDAQGQIAARICGGM